MAYTARLPDPVDEQWDWQRLAACRRMEVARFFHPVGERGRAWRRREAEAKQICDRCPVIQACLEHAISAEEPYGVWGGMGEHERREIVLRRRRGARRPHAAAPDPGGRGPAVRRDAVGVRLGCADYGIGAAGRR